MQLRPIGAVRSSLLNRRDAPKQGAEGAPEAWIDIDERYVAALDGLRAGDPVMIVTWLHEADREVLAVHPRGDRRRPLTGVFATRSPDRPNPLGLHPASITRIDGRRISVAPLEAIDGTPVVDIKPLLEGDTR